MRENNFVCDYCGVGGYKSPYFLLRNKNNFCCRDCFYKFMDRKCEVICVECGSVFIKKQDKINRAMNNFCSLDCIYMFRNNQIEVECLVCNKKFMKGLSRIKNHPKHFCSLDCAKRVQEFKDWGSKRSKLEILIEKHLGVVMSDLFIDYNKTDIGYELDIYIPSVKLAIEINGLFHYKPIFGMEKLLRTQEIDREKVIICKEMGIKLVVINVSGDGNGAKIQVQRISEVEGIIRDRINSFSVVM